MIRYHDAEACAGQHCTLHNPSDHHMRDWPLTLRETTLMERKCPHGIGHPDPDSLAHLQRVAPGGAWDIHGCDGCC